MFNRTNVHDEGREQVVYQASREQQQENTRMDVLVVLDKHLEDNSRDQRAVLALQKRIYARQQMMARCWDQAGGTTLLARHYGAQAALPYVAENTLR